MSTVQEYEKCPQCGGVYDHSVNLGNGEETGRCYRCGKRFTKRVVLGKDNRCKKDGDGNPVYITEDISGLGVVGAVGVNGDTHKYFLLEPYDPETQKAFNSLLLQECIDKANSYLTRWDKKQNKVIAVYGRLPESFEEFVNSE